MLSRLSGSRTSGRDSSASGDDLPSSPRNSSRLSRGLSSSLLRRPGSGRSVSDGDVRKQVLDLTRDMETLRATLRELQVRREAMSNPAMFEVDVHEMFLGGNAFQETLQTLQSCQERQKALLADSGRVSALCPTEYPELLRLSVEIMTSFSRLAARPGAQDAPPEEILAASEADARQRVVTASI